MRFNVPLGVKLAPGLALPPNVQLSPGTVLGTFNRHVCRGVGRDYAAKSDGIYVPVAKYLEVVDFPPHHFCPPGTALVKEVNAPLPGDFVKLAPTHGTKLPPQTIYVKLPRVLNIYGARELAANVSVGLESVLDSYGYARALPEGQVFISRDNKHLPLPAGLSLIPQSQAHSKLRQVVDAVNMSSLPRPEKIAAAAKEKEKEKRPASRGSEHSTSSERGGALAVDQKAEVNLEVAAIDPVFRLPEGVCVVPGATVCLAPVAVRQALPSNVHCVLVPSDPAQKAEVLERLARKGVYEVCVPWPTPPPYHPPAHHNYLFSPHDPLARRLQRHQPKHLRALEVAHRHRRAVAVEPVTRPQFCNDLLPSCMVLVQLPDTYEVHSWGPALPGVQAVSVFASAQEVGLFLNFLGIEQFDDHVCCIRRRTAPCCSMLLRGKSCAGQFYRLRISLLHDLAQRGMHHYLPHSN